MSRKRPYLENERFWDLPDQSLRYIIKDAGEAAKANPDCPKAGVWLDEVNDACSVLYHRNNR